MKFTLFPAINTRAPKIRIDLDREKQHLAGSYAYTTNDIIRGMGSITASEETAFADVDIVFEGLFVIVFSLWTFPL
jgi:hypothetical protein